MWRVMFCFWRFWMCSVVVSMFWLVLLRISIFYMRGGWVVLLNGVLGEDGWGNGLVVVGFVGGGLLRLSSVRSVCVCVFSSEGWVIVGCR